MESQNEEAKVEQVVGENNGYMIGKGWMVNLNIHISRRKKKCPSVQLPEGWSLASLVALLGFATWAGLRLIYSGVGFY